MNKKYKRAYFIGGSTTECIYNHEGKRWPDLISNMNTFNYGVGAKSIVNSLRKLELLIESGAKIDTLFIMHACNDFTNLVRPTTGYGAKRKSLINNIIENLYFVSNTIYFYRMFFVKEKDARNATVKILTKTTLSPYAKKVEVKKTLLGSVGDAYLSDDEFGEFYKKNIKGLYARYEILEKIHNLTKKNNIKLILLTQPNSFLVNYLPPYEKDLRLTAFGPKFGGKDGFFTFLQYRKLMDGINDQTIKFAKEKKIDVIDVSKEFLKYNPSPLFIDGFHYTDNGSILFSKIVNDFLQPIRQ